MTISQWSAAAKTGIDAIVWLLDNGANPDSITWICPRDSWLITRESVQPGLAFFEKSVGGFASNVEAMRDATSVEDLFERMEAAGTMCRVDKSVTPEMFHYATISEGELTHLRSLTNIVRGQRVARIEADQMVMADGEPVPTRPQTLYIDCTARAVEFQNEIKTKTIFEPGLITLQPLMAPLITYSAAIAAYVEAHFESDKEKNELCDPVPLADTPAEWLPSTLGNMKNNFAWSQNREMNRWLTKCRLNPNFTAIQEGAGRSDPHRALRDRIMQNSMHAVMNAHRLIAAHEAGE